MKSFLLLVVLAYGCAAQTSAAQSGAPETSSGSGQTASAPDPTAIKARELIMQMIQALGGDAYLHFADTEQEGRTNGFYHGNPTGGSAPFWRFYKYPAKERVELTKGRDWIVIHNGDQGTETTFHGTKPEEEDAHKEYLLREQYSLDHVLRDWLNAPGTAFFYDGSGFTDNHQVENVTIANAKDQQVTIAIEEFTHLPVRKSFTVRDPVYKDKNTYSEIYSEYRVTQGIQTPYVLTRVKNDEMAAQRFLSKVTYNQGLQDSFFVPPTSISKKK
jgi:opacity protein-like surface antigen